MYVCMYVFFFLELLCLVLFGWSPRRFRLSGPLTGSEKVNGHHALVIVCLCRCIKQGGKVQTSRRWSGSRECLRCLALCVWLAIIVRGADSFRFLFEVVAERRGCFHASALAGSLESLCGDDPLLSIKVGLGATLSATKTVPFLPKCVAVVSWIVASESLVNAWAGNEELKCFFIDSFVDVESTLQAFEIACGFCIVVLLLARWCLVLLC